MVKIPDLAACQWRDLCRKARDCNSRAEEGLKLGTARSMWTTKSLMYNVSSEATTRNASGQFSDMVVPG